MEYLNMMLSWLSWETIATIILLYLSSLSFYRLFLHPLARFPGPKLAAITRWFEGYYDVVRDGQYTFQIAKLHQKYGPIVRISPHELHISDAAFYNTLYCQDGRWDRYAWAWDAWGAEGPTIHTVHHEQHRARRQPLATFFSRAKVLNRQEMIRKHVEKFCHHLSQIAVLGKTVNLGAAISALARDVAFDYILAKSYNSLDSEDFDVAVLHSAQGAGPLWRLTKHTGYVFHILNSLPIDWAMKLSDDNMKTFFTHMKAAMKDTKDLIASVSSLTLDNKAQRTIVHEILDSKLPSRDKSFQRVFEEVTSVSGAGFETTGSALRLICFHVFSNTEVLRRLRTELKAAEAENSDVMVLKVLEKLPYLTSTIMEGLRLSPGVATRMARIAPDRDLFYKEYKIPAGTPVGMTTILMHTDEELYPDPMSFNPERWMGHRGMKIEEKAYAPFSRGTRMCIGMHLAWAEMYFVIAALVQHFDFHFLAAKAEDFECMSDQFVIGTKGKGLLEARVEYLGMSLGGSKSWSTPSRPNRRTPTPRLGVGAG
ncbi:trichodiene oxygenase [Xylaria sp. FL0043]|nr:trichodiene oxygenase [Xylaria sp. FL0043]